MAWALISGLLRHGVAASQLRVGEPLAAQRARLQGELGVTALADNHEAVRDAQLVVLAVKPQQLAAMLADVCPALGRSRPLLLSVAAGARVAGLAACCPGLPIVRAMPNRPALAGLGATALYAATGVGAPARALAESVCATVGRAVWVQRESDLDIVTALSGSGPAYFLLLAEHLAAAATAQGLNPATAELLAAQTLRGAAALAEGTATLAAQRAAVTSEGGTTAAALATLAGGGFDKLIAAAIAAATRRSAALAALTGQAAGPGESG